MMSNQTLTQAQGPRCFWVNQGPIVSDLIELKQALSEMSAETFEYHTKRDGNDFAVWADAVLGEAALAKKLAKLKTRKAQIKAIEKRIAKGQ